MGQLDVNSSNWSSGTRFIDSCSGLVTGIRHAHDGDQAAVAAEIGLASFATTLDAVEMALDPLSKLTAAGLGWMVEHIQFLRTPLDLLAGNPAEIAHIAEQVHESAAVVRNAAHDLATASRTATAQWWGPAADAFADSMAIHQHRLDVVSESVDAVGYVVETSMAVIAALRNLIRDMITSVLGDIVSTMLVALAAAPATSGASIVVGLSRCVMAALTWVVEMFARIAKVAGLSGRAARRIDDLVEILGKLAKDLGGKYDKLRGITRVKPGDKGRVDPAPSLSSDGPQHPAPPLRVTRDSDFHDDGLGDEIYRDWLAADRKLNGNEKAGSERRGDGRSTRPVSVKSNETFDVRSSVVLRLVG